MSIIIIQKSGWRTLYKMMGAIGIFLATAVMFFVKEPKNKIERPEIKEEKTIEEPK